MLSSLYRPCSRYLGLRLPTAARVSALARFQSPGTSASDGGPSPILLQRARAMAAEHSVLSTQNATHYNVTTAKRIGELSTVVDALKTWDEAHSSLSELENLLADPTSDGELQSLASSDIASLKSSLPTLSRRLSTALIPPHPFTALPCLLEFHPGAGGSEASLFAHELLHMYTSCCARLGLSYTLQSYAKDESVSGNGITHAILAINSPGTYNTFRSEIGVHRVQRVPATEKKGRTHTSAVSVMVLPQLPESGENELNYDDPNSDYYIAPNDVRSETMRASGAGGQHVNKTESAIRLTHIPTGIVVGVQEERSQHKNRDQAWKILRSRIAARRREEREAETIALRRKAMGGVARTGREDKVRTYNFSQNRVSDHRSGWEGSNLPEIMEGGLGLDSLMESVREWMDENEFKGLIAEEEERAREKTRGI